MDDQMLHFVHGLLTLAIGGGVGAVHRLIKAELKPLQQSVVKLEALAEELGRVVHVDQVDTPKD
jgi:hypothetical protein